MNQSSTVVGEGNTVVQIEGNGHTVVLGKPHLKLTRFEADQAGKLTDIRVLLPTARAIPMVGREEEMANLLQFVQGDSPNDIRVRVLIGGGGSGKTRLALELCNHIKATWNAGFLTTHALKRFFTQQDASDWGWQKPTLIVLDYAAAHAAVLGEWLRELQDRPPPRHPLRILLLERHANPESGWHQAAFSLGGWGRMGNRDLLDPPEPIPIRSLPEQSDRMAILSSVIERCAPHLLEKLVNEPSLHQQLSESPWAGDPLYLAMAALTMARNGNTRALSLGRTDLAMEVAGHEQQRLHQLAVAHAVDPHLVEHLCACITLAQSMLRSHALKLAESEKPAIGFHNADAPARLVDVLQEAFPEGDEGIAAIRPDLIGEAFLIKAWKKPERAKAIERMFDENPQAVLESLVRLMQDFDATIDAPHRWFSSLIETHKDDAQRLEQMDAAVPGNTVALSRINLTLAARLFELNKSGGNTDPGSTAVRYMNLSIAFHRDGQREKALAAVQEAVDLYRELARQRPDAFTPNLAGSLNNLANRLSELGQREKALAAAQEAVDLRRELARQRPDAFTPNLAGSLNNLANRLSELGQREKALAAAQEAVDLYRELARQRPDAFTPDLAMSLNNLASFLSALGQREKALAAAQEAVDLRRDLARQRPDAFTPNLAGSPIVLARQCEQLLDAVKAHGLAHEAAKTLSPAFLQRPQVHLHLMAKILRDYVRLCEASQQEPDHELLLPLLPFFQSPPEPKD
jgi:tetratricopeptide (TPR) repeat protein